MHIFIDKYLGGGRFALALTLIFGLEVWWCVLFAGKPPVTPVIES